MLYQNFIYGSYESDAVTADCEKTVNWFPERMESPGATTRWALLPTPGATLLSGSQAIGAGGGRGHFVADGREFAMVGAFFYEVGQFGAYTLRGTLAIDSNPATFSYNGDGGDQLFITTGGNGYIYNMTSHLVTQITALNGKATMGDHLDGYFLALDAATSTLYISNILAGLTWVTGTNFAQRSKQPDPWISMKVSGNYIWLLGELTSELWYDTGASFPFSPHPSGQIPYGIKAPFSVARVGTGLSWLGTSVSGEIVALQATGFTPEVVSNIPVQLALSGYTITADACGFSYSDRGHTFYVLTFPTQDVTWAWDVTTGQWHERGTWNTETSEYEAWRPLWHAYAYGEHRVLDLENSGLYRLSSTIHTDVGGLAIRRLRRAPTLMHEMQRVYYSAFELDLEPGLGTATGQGSDPHVMLRFSNDGGKTWSNEMMRSAGKIGEYGKRVRWNRLGSGRRRVFEVTTSDPIAWKLTAAYLTLGQQPDTAPQPQARQ